MSDARIAADAGWLADALVQRLLAALNADGAEARIVGGAVRNALLGQPVTEIDIATTTVPAETARRGAAAGFRAVDTGAEHGTMTLVAEGRGFEVTTLRADVETDGRRAKVHFGRDWKADAERRDFTINGLYADPDGTVIDLVGGLDDIAARRLRFIGDAETRIREDYLRILRFFRFFAWYGDGRPDADGLRACARLKAGVDGLSAERVWAELKKLLGAPDPARALLWMRQSGVLSRVLPESEKWGIDSIHALVAAERDLGWTPDALLRLEAIVPPDGARMEAMGKRLKLSRAEAARLGEWAGSPQPGAATTEAALRAMLYRGQPQGLRDRLRLALAGARARAVTDTPALMEAGQFSKLLAVADNWQRPMFPLTGADLKALGVREGAALGALLRRLEDCWIDSGFVLRRDALIDAAKAAIAENPTQD
jgi:tRNA nucleotidyltransferase/poly(A) polymerase